MALYDAFVSYSHAKDKPIAAALQSVVQKLGKPWYRRRALRVFRDDTSLSATPTLWPTIEQALGRSRFLILLASPEAAASPWVDKEVAYWLEHKGADTLLIALTDGELAWDNAAGDFVRREHPPLPPALIGRFASEPKWVDVTSYRDGADPRDSRFLEAGADFAAAIHGMPKEDLLSQEVRQQRRALTLAWTAAGLLLLLAGAAGWEGALAAYEEGLAIMRKVAAANPNDAAWQRDLGVTLEKVGDVRLAAGDWTGALAIYEESLAIRRKLAAADPGNTRWQRDLTFGLNKVGDVLLAGGDHSGALAAYDEGLGVRRKLAAVDPGNALWQRDLTASLERVGDARLAADDRAGALAAYEEALTIMRKLVASDPGNVGWQRDLSASLGKVGDARQATGNRAEALAAYEEGLAIKRTLAAADASNIVWRANLVIGLVKTSMVSEPARARPLLREALAIAEALEREGKLTAAQRSWPQDIRDRLAALPPEQAEAR